MMYYLLLKSFPTCCWFMKCAWDQIYLDPCDLVPACTSVSWCITFSTLYCVREPTAMPEGGCMQKARDVVDYWWGIREMFL